MGDQEQKVVRPGRTNLKESRENYYYFSGKASDIVRQLGFAGIAIIWVFRLQQPHGELIPHDLVGPAVLIVGGLALDLLQYVWASAAWGIFTRHKEKGDAGSTEFDAPEWINWPTLAFFWGKILTVGVAYAFLIDFLARRFY